MLGRPGAGGGILEEVEAMALKRFQGNEEATRKKLEEKYNLLATRIHDFEQKQI